MNFPEFHARNPEVLTKLIAITRYMLSRKKVTKISSRIVWESYRIECYLDAIGASDEYKLNNNLLPDYARAIMQADGLAGCFETRKRKHEPVEEAPADNEFSSEEWGWMMS